MSRRQIIHGSILFLAGCYTLLLLSALSEACERQAAEELGSLPPYTRAEADAQRAMMRRMEESAREAGLFLDRTEPALESKVRVDAAAALLFGEVPDAGEGAEIPADWSNPGDGLVIESEDEP